MCLVGQCTNVAMATASIETKLCPNMLEQTSVTRQTPLQKGFRVIVYANLCRGQDTVLAHQIHLLVYDVILILEPWYQIAWRIVLGTL